MVADWTFSPCNPWVTFHLERLSKLGIVLLLCSDSFDHHLEDRGNGSELPIRQRKTPISKSKDPPAGPNREKKLVKKVVIEKGLLKGVLAQRPFTMGASPYRLPTSRDHYGT